MPYRTNRRKAPAYRAKKRTVYRRKKAYRKRQNNPSKLVYRPKKALGSIVPDRYFTKLRYNYYGTRTLSTGTIDTEFSLNSIRDCGTSVDSTNVQGFTELTGLYSNWRVHMSKIQLQIANGDNASTVSSAILFPVVNDAKLPNSVAGLLSLPYSKHKMISAVGGNSSMIRLNHAMSVKRILGLKTLANQEDIVGSTSANPTVDIKWYLRLYQVSNSNQAFVVNATITYYVEFFNRSSAINQS